MTERASVIETTGNYYQPKNNHSKKFVNYDCLQQIIQQY
ncbi:hypothetical protein H1P_4290003 [Hyella patelloides LEGE 07179]|uniref:Uncharacterized protein n=1 Tax=Hyella patelloides LEGE 07179 TaxID=945734 RepID=A0A563VXX3_9CYAN|nr:hypothetical protein H1P_4290003 [Hyella patelloides LEGE 07179]